MARHRVKQELLDGGISLGTFLMEFSTTGIVRLAAEAGAEFAVLDMEHTGWSIETIRMLIATSHGTELVPIVRVPATEYHFIARVLDMGACGIMAPMVGSAEQAQKIVDSAKYPPAGRRGAAFTVAHDNYTGGDIIQKMSAADSETILIAQIETADGLNNVEAIAAVNGLDVLWIGHFDLSNALGIPGQFDHPRFQEALRTVLAACERHRKIPAFLAGDLPTAKRLLDQGFRMLAYGADLWLYQTALRDGLAALRGHSRG